MPIPINGSITAAYLHMVLPHGCPQGDILSPCSASIKPDQLDPWIKDQIGNALLSTILPLQLRNFVSSLPPDTKFGTCRGEIVDRRMICIWSLIHGSGWSGLIKAEPYISIEIAFSTAWIYIMENTIKFCHFRSLSYAVNTLRPRKNGYHFAEDIFRCKNKHLHIYLIISSCFVYIQLIYQHWFR